MSARLECETLFESLLSEAKGDAGTWSLATYTKTRSALRSFGNSEKEHILKRIINVILVEERPETNYKLSQMCTLIHTFQDPVYEGVFKVFEQKIMDRYADLQRQSDLGQATVRLLQSLFTTPKSGRSVSPFAATPTLRPLFTHQISRTPDPTMLLKNMG